MTITGSICTRVTGMQTRMQITHMGQQQHSRDFYTFTRAIAGINLILTDRDGSKVWRNRYNLVTSVVLDVSIDLSIADVLSSRHSSTRARLDCS